MSKSTTISVKTPKERQLLLRLIEGRDLPFTATLVRGEPRSLAQNRLSWLWLKEAGEQGNQTSEEYRAECKLGLGIPILLRDNEAFAAHWEAYMRFVPYEAQLKSMIGPYALKVTSLMTVEQEREYLDAMYHYLTEQGICLTDPQLLGLDLTKYREVG